MVVHTYHEGGEAERYSLGYIARHCVKQRKQNNTLIIPTYHPSLATLRLWCTVVLSLSLVIVRPTRGYSSTEDWTTSQ
jgi:hypothetical protein